jgi:topoisomerase-4 subunit A
VSTEKGKIEEVSASDLRQNDRYSNGSFIIDETDAGKAKTVWSVIHKDESEVTNN